VTCHRSAREEKLELKKRQPLSVTQFGIIRASENTDGCTDSCNKGHQAENSEDKNLHGGSSRDLDIGWLSSDAFVNSLDASVRPPWLPYWTALQALLLVALI